MQKVLYVRQRLSNRRRSIKVVKVCLFCKASQVVFELPLASLRQYEYIYGRNVRARI